MSVMGCRYRSLSTGAAAGAHQGIRWLGALIVAAGLASCQCSESPRPKQVDDPNTRDTSTVPIPDSGTTDSAPSDDTARPPSEPWIDVAAGLGFTVGIRESGTLEFWGLNFSFDEAPPLGEFVAVDAGEGFACAIRVEGTIACWGCAKDTPDVLCQPPEGEYTAIFSFGDHSCAVATTGETVCWGWPDEVPLEASSFPYTLALGLQRSCQLASPGAVPLCWGMNTLPDWVIYPPEVAFNNVALGSVHGCGLDVQGQPVCWGTGIIDAVNPDASLPYPDCPFEGSFADIVSSNRDTCVADAAGIWQCWVSEGWPDPPLEPPAVSFEKLDLGAFHGCGLTEDREILCFGQGGNGELDVPY